MKNVLTVFLVFCMANVFAGSDIDGRWYGKLSNNDEVLLDLKSDGKILTGSVSTDWRWESIIDGKISAGGFTFSGERDQDVITYSGKISNGKLVLSVKNKENTYTGTFMKMKADEPSPLAGKMRPQMTEYWAPVPKVIDPGAYAGMAPPPSDAIVLFNGKDLSEWKSRDGGEAKWKVEDGVFTVVKGTGDITTKRKFGDYQLHIEWRVPADITGESQARGNSGLFLQDLSDDLKIPDYWYEVQILDSYNNATYVNGQAGSVYKQNPPLFNATRKPGEWNVYDVIYTAPRFNENGTLFSPAKVTVLHNGVLIQDNFQIRGHTAYIGHPRYIPHGKAPISLQDHGDPSKAISFRNIWVRER